ncbi:hypothetical protein BsWGS_27789 [Bradybaena similaris]
MANLNSLPGTSSGELVKAVLIVENLDSSVFSNAETKAAFESTFRDVDSKVTFTYLQNIQGARLQFSSSDFAMKALAKFNGVVMFGKTIGCYNLQSRTASEGFLQLPQKERIFLLSPPGSPPVGWEPRYDLEPTINSELLAAIASLGTGKDLVIHYSGSDTAPQIVLSLSDNAADVKNEEK